ncbi:MAG: DUF4418 family protein [Oscillospiraceae bacterium]|nr:DUF4418 family protein [Oscillospiraceae bacterium]
MEQKKTSVRIFDIVQLVLCACFFLGLLFVFGPCGPKEDGGWMTCHWAGQAVAGVAAVLTVLALLRLAVRNNGVKAGLSLASIPASLLAVLIPGRLIGLCMMADMRCHMVMTPSVTVFSLLILALAAVDSFLLLKKK